MNLTASFRSYCRQHQLIQPGDTILVGISGGKDSVALAHLLASWRHDAGLRIVLAHFNHRLRPSAGGDEKFVRKLADAWDLEVHFGHSRARLARAKGSLEENARNARFEFLTRLARRIKADKIALAHTRDDLAETVLMRMIRGGGTKGLAAILPERMIDGVTVVRPLLSARTEDILAYLRRHQLPCRRDPTNRQTKFLRNKLRLQLLPLLERQYNPNIKKVLAQLSEHLALEHECLSIYAQAVLARLTESKGAGHLSLDLRKLAGAHPAMLRLVLRRAIETLKGDLRRLEYAHVEELIDLIRSRPKGSIVHLPADVRAVKQPTTIKLYISKA